MIAITQGAAVAATLAIALAAIGLYLLPFWIALYRRNPSRWAILTLNLFLGWTLLGWVGSMVWAASGTSADWRRMAR